MDLPTIVGTIRSLVIYRARPWRTARMRRFYRAFVPDGGLAFDIGAHVGDRIACFRALGARVVAVEPQPHLAALLRHLHGRDGGVTLLDCALGPAAGTAVLKLNRRNPTLSTLSSTWAGRVGDSPRFPGERWEGSVTVPVRPLDDLIAAHGPPDFVKIDVEGFEAEVLAGLSRPVRALSLEFLPETPDAALACLDRLAGLGDYRFQTCRGESFLPEQAGWTDAVAMRAHLAALPPGHPGGDLYARLA
ncbi:MAG: hypothetical protein RLY86_2133 [Pseudomonadota bacterium]|jgi:FkbM family methyltransferase